MNTTQISCFLAVAKTGSVSKAAEELFLAQPSISRYIAQLEQEWRVELFVRSGRSMKLTPEGEDYFHLCTRLMKDLADLKKKHTSDPATTRYSINYSVFPAWNVTPLISDNAVYIRNNHPYWDISLKICRADTLMDALRNGEVDIIFYVGSLLARYPEFATEPLIDLPQLILYSKNDPLSEKKDLVPEDFKDRDFLYVPDSVLTPEIMHRQVRSVEKRYGFTFRPRILENTDSLILALETGQGVALMDYWSRYRTNPNLKAYTLDLPLQVVLAWLKNRPNPAIEEFVSDTKKYFQTHLY